MTAPTQLFGKYQIRRELGRGAMGVVYEAADAVNGETVALKIMALPPQASAESRQRQQERFDREAQALDQLDHPRVVRLLERGELGGRHFFAMELLRGTTLRDRVQFQGPLGVGELIRLGIEMCHALDHVHLRGVVHRDVKPENIMLMSDGSAKLMDFGIARLVLERDTPASAGFQGSPAYMSPEQVLGQRADGRSDLYSLAVTLYEAATGRRAVEGDSIANIVHKVVSEYPPPPAGLPGFVQAVLMRAMAKDPVNRYARGWDMAEDLRLQRTPQVSFSPIPQAAPPSAARPGPSYFGYAPNPAPPSSGSTNTAAAPDYAALAEFWLPAEAQPAPVAAGTTAADAIVFPASLAEGPLLPSCRLHPALPGLANCPRCGHPMCRTCTLELPGEGIICRTCAFSGS